MRIVTLVLLNALLSGCVVTTAASAVATVAGTAAGVAVTAAKVPLKVGAKVVSGDGHHRDHAP